MTEFEPIEDILRTVYAYFSRDGALLARTTGISGVRCVYRREIDNEVRMCAVGCLLREEEGEFDIPFVKSNNEVPRYKDRHNVPLRWRSAEHLRLLAALQRAHDTALHVPQLLSTLRRMAKRRGIDLTQPAA